MENKGKPTVYRRDIYIHEYQITKKIPKVGLYNLLLRHTDKLPYIVFYPVAL